MVISLQSLEPDHLNPTLINRRNSSLETQFAHHLPDRMHSFIPSASPSPSDHILFSITWIYYCPYKHTVIICVFLPDRTRELLEDKHCLIHFSIPGTTAVPGTLTGPQKTIRSFRGSIFSPTEVQLTNQVMDYVNAQLQNIHLYHLSSLNSFWNMENM